MSKATDFLQTTVDTAGVILGQQAQDVVNSELTDALRKSLVQGRTILRAEIANSGAVATRTLYDSVASKINAATVGAWVYNGDIFFAGRAASYVFNADQGRQAGQQPPASSLLVWIQKKGIDEKFLWPILKKIAREGTGVGSWASYGRKPFMRDAIAQIDIATKINFEKAAQRIAARLSNGTS